MELFEQISAFLDIAGKLKTAYEKTDKAQIKAIIADFQNTATDAQLEVSNAKIEILKLREENSKLKQQVDVKKSLIQGDDRLYYTKEKKGPYCPKCIEADGKAISLHLIGNEDYWECPNCENTYLNKNRQPDQHYSYNNDDDNYI